MREKFNEIACREFGTIEASLDSPHTMVVFDIHSEERVHIGVGEARELLKWLQEALPEQQEAVMREKFNPSPAALRASWKEYPDGCCTHPYQVTNLRHAFVLGYAAGQQAIRRRRRTPTVRER